VSQLDLQFIFKDYQEKQTILNVLNEQQGIKNYVTEQTITPEIRNWSMLSFELVDYLDDTCILIGVTDITDLKIKEEELHKHASIDMLTGVMNRRRGLEMLHKQIDGGFSSQEFILCYIDINNLKMVNDLFGHSTGDELIKLCCETIIHHLGPDDILFRLGGDEFIIMFYNKYLHDAMLIWNNIEREFQNINQTKQRPFPISASHGFYHYQPGTIITVQEMLEMADQEMYKEKFIHKSLNNSQLIQHP
jgi:diguanylate cyclase (GGDEF)-like protein